MLEKICDFAMEFYADGENGISYEGLSIFETQTKGMFSGGWLGHAEFLQKFLTIYISEETLAAVREAVTLTLKEILGNVYRGYLETARPITSPPPWPWSSVMTPRRAGGDPTTQRDRKSVV